MDYTNLSAFGNIPLTDQTIYLTDLIRDLVVQLDNKVMIAIMVILTAEVLYDLILPIFRDHDYQGKYMHLKPFIKPVIIKTINILKDVGMMCAMFIWYVFMKQNGFTTPYIIWTVILSVLVILVIIYRIYKWRESKSLSLESRAELGQVKHLQESISSLMTSLTENESSLTSSLKESQKNLEEE